MNRKNLRNPYPFHASYKTEIVMRRRPYNRHSASHKAKAFMARLKLSLGIA
jgi:hypothetical protein